MQSCTSNAKPKEKPKKAIIPVTIHLESNCSSNTFILEKNGQKECYEKKPFITGDNIKLISLTSGLVKKYDLIIEFDEQGTKILKEVTTNNIDKKVTIIFDGDVITTPIIKMPINNGKIMVTGAWENEEKVYNFVKKIEKDIEQRK